MRWQSAVDRPPATNDELLAYVAGTIWGEDHPDDLNGGLAVTVQSIINMDALGATCDRLGCVQFWRWWRKGFDRAVKPTW